MEPEQLRELATNAQLDHWPPHLGVRTEAEKIQYLASQLQAAATIEANNDELREELKAAQDRIDWLESDNDELKDKLKKIREIAQ